MNNFIGKKVVNDYFRLMKHWDNSLKKDLIIKLAQSIDNYSEGQGDFSTCFGAWQDERSAEGIIDEMYGDRANSREIEEF